jgi:proline iminopeptidase
MTIEGARLFVRAMDGPEGDLPPLLALYGTPGDQTHECSQAAFCFLAHEGHVFVFDARGNGASDGRPSLTLERWVRDVDELRAALGVETIVLAGHSYSGWSDYWADS